MVLKIYTTGSVSLSLLSPEWNRSRQKLMSSARSYKPPLFLREVDRARGVTGPGGKRIRKVQKLPSNPHFSSKCIKEEM
jgi:hypothetical protein